MPCTYYTREEEAEMARTELREELNLATRVACSALRALEGYTFQNSAWEEEESAVEFLPDEIKTWWKKHQRMDEAREEDEAREKAASRKKRIKLTRKESERFVKALRNPKKPTKALIKGIKRYKKAIKTGKIISR